MVDLKEKKKELLSLYTGKNEFLDTDKQKSVLKKIEQLHIPDAKTEEWKHTNPAEILKHKFTLGKKETVPEESTETFLFYGLETDRLVFVNGNFDKKESKISQSNNNIVIDSLKNAQKTHKSIIENNYAATNPHENNFFAAINTAYAQDGAFIFVPENTVSEKPIHIVNFIYGNNQKVFSQTKNLIVVGKNAKIKIISTYHSLSEDFTINNIVTEIICKENSSTEFYIFEGEGNFASHINNTFVKQSANSFF